MSHLLVVIYTFFPHGFHYNSGGESRLKACSRFAVYQHFQTADLDQCIIFRKILGGPFRALKMN